MARRLTCSLDSDEVEVQYQMPLLAASRPQGPTLLGQIPSEELGLGEESHYEIPWEPCPICHRAKRKDRECTQCYSSGG